MTKSPITLQELRRRIYVKAKAEKSWLNVRHRVVTPARIAERTASLEIRLKL